MLSAELKARLKPGFRFRYVDDTLSSWCHGLDNLQRFLDHINSLHPSIKFTYEVHRRMIKLYHS